jgi:GntR family transcriptional regulator, transcriptional repressor for pyruvate dehydrogenase complex
MAHRWVATEGLEPIAPREARSTEVARRLLDYLLSGSIKTGERIPSERQLAAQLGVGRSAVRDALRPLLLLGVVDARQGDGTYLRQPESSLLPQAVEWGLLLGEHTTIDLIEARAYIEVALAELAASRRTRADLQQMESLLRQMAQPGVTGSEFNEADLAFHLAIAQASGNTVLFGTIASIRTLLRVWITRVTAAASSTKRSYEEHVPVFEAIRASDPAAAAAAMRAHMESARTRLTETLKASDSPESDA